MATPAGTARTEDLAGNGAGKGFERLVSYGVSSGPPIPQEE
ncbi:hypothetical protein [Planococcus lenghuensis]|nr:hypothetical protein [Planococcus lenghuensis]